MTRSANGYFSTGVRDSMRSLRHWVRMLIGVSLVAAAVGAYRADAQEARPESGASVISDGMRRLDKAVPDVTVRDLHLSFLPQPGESTFRLPLSLHPWILSGFLPYAALSPRVLRSPTDGLIGLAVPDRESLTDLSHGLGLGAGFSWRLSDRLDLFGEYLFRAQPAGGVPGTSPVLRPDVEGTGLKGGLSIHF
jgi:hypothetical protein